MSKAKLNKELKSLEEAISRLQKGERVSSVSYNGHSVSYFGLSLKELLEQRQRIELKINELDKKLKKQIIFATHKGVQ